MLNYLYENDIKVKDKYFETEKGLHICPIIPSAALPSLMRLSL
jgi:hypothetical protein